jgi:predicted ATP-dependent serine protease
MMDSCEAAGFDFSHWWGWCPACINARAEQRKQEIEEEKVQALKKANELKEWELHIMSTGDYSSNRKPPVRFEAETKPKVQRRGL